MQRAAGEAKEFVLSTSAAALLLMLIHLTHLQVVVGALSIIAGRLNPEQVSEVDPNKVAVLCRNHPAITRNHPDAREVALDSVNVLTLCR